MNYVPSAQLGASSYETVVPDPTVLTLSLRESELQDLIDEIENSDWVCGQRQDDTNVTRLQIRHALLKVLEEHWDDMLNQWGPEDWMRGDLSRSLQTEILDKHDRDNELTRRPPYTT